MSSFTSGPWHLEDGRTGRMDHINVCHGDNYTAGAASGVIAKVTCRVSWRKEQRSNAELIASAPDLYHAAKRMLEAFDVASTPAQITATLKMITAIGKAEGTSND